MVVHSLTPQVSLHSTGWFLGVSCGCHTYYIVYLTEQGNKYKPWPPLQYVVGLRGEFQPKITYREETASILTYVTQPNCQNVFFFSGCAHWLQTQKLLCQDKTTQNVPVLSSANGKKGSQSKDRRLTGKTTEPRTGRKRRTCVGRFSVMAGEVNVEGTLCKS